MFLKPGDIEAELRAARLSSRWRKLDLVLAAIGAEIGSLFLILLALEILVAPTASGLGVTWLAMDWAARLSGGPVPGWIAGVIVFAFLCRYVWGSGLQRASRRAAEALIAGK